MAESKHHRHLVERAVFEIQCAIGQDKGFSCVADGVSTSLGVPPAISGYRPDIFATTDQITVVGEAKPPWDIESTRSEAQLATFMGFVERNARRHIVLAVHWSNSATGQGILRSVAQDWNTVRDRVHIVDGQRRLNLPSSNR